MHCDPKKVGLDAVAALRVYTVGANASKKLIYDASPQILLRQPAEVGPQVVGHVRQARGRRNGTGHRRVAEDELEEDLCRARAVDLGSPIACPGITGLANRCLSPAKLLIGLNIA